MTIMMHDADGTNNHHNDDDVAAVMVVAAAAATTMMIGNHSGLQYPYSENNAFGDSDID